MLYNTKCYITHVLYKSAPGPVTAAARPEAARGPRPVPARARAVAAAAAGGVGIYCCTTPAAPAAAARPATASARPAATAWLGSSSSLSLLTNSSIPPYFLTGTTLATVVRRLGFCAACQQGGTRRTRLQSLCGGRLSIAWRQVGAVAHA